MGRDGIGEVRPLFLADRMDANAMEFFAMVMDRYNYTLMHCFVFLAAWCIQRGIHLGLLVRLPHSDLVMPTDALIRQITHKQSGRATHASA